MTALATDFAIFPYSIAELERLLVAYSKADAHTISNKSHRQYFENYFSTLQTGTILVETCYTDADFLDDFVQYYVRCFAPYERTCTRLHFFSLDFTATDFSAFLDGSTSILTREALQDAYIGFIVVKPLPRTIIGRTCLVTYPEETRRFPILREYHAHPFGLHLSVKTLAFQEQDSVAAACATSALWSAFHGTGVLFHHHIPSPVAITQAATQLAPVETRVLPDTHGLTVGQMAQAIRSVGLEPFLVRVNDEYILKSTLYAYLRAGIPVLMQVYIAEPLASPSSAETHTIIDGHAVTIAGFNLGLSSPPPAAQTGFLLRAARIDKIYAHDDQVGPFSRMPFDGVQVTVRNTPTPFTSLPWDGARGASFRAVPASILVPVYHKIRIPFEKAHDIVVRFDSVLEECRQIFLQQGQSFLPTRPEWDIFLTTVQDFKEDILQGTSVTGEYKLGVLRESYPRFLWRAKAYCNDDVVLELLFDATDIEQGAFFLRAIEYDAAVSGILHVVASLPLAEQAYRARGVWEVMGWFKDPVP